MARQLDIQPFSTVHESGQYPAWLRKLRRKNGVYAIRDRRSKQLLYIGESHTNRLYGTATRHFQQWSDSWDTAGPTYDRDDIELAALQTPPSHASPLQVELICLGKPRDNRLTCDEARDIEDAPPRHYDYDLNQLARELLDIEPKPQPWCRPVRDSTARTREPDWLPLIRAADAICAPTGIDAATCTMLEEALEALSIDDPLSMDEALAELGYSRRTIEHIKEACEDARKVEGVPF